MRLPTWRSGAVDDDGDVLGRGAEADPETRAVARDRQVARPTRQPHAVDHRAAARVDDRHAASPRVGHERMNAVGMRRGVARLDEAAHDVAHARAVDDRQRADRGVADERARSPTRSTERGSASVAIEPAIRSVRRSTTASRDSASHVTSATAAGQRALRAARRARRRRRRGTRGGSRPELRPGRCARSRYGGRMSHPELQAEQAYVDRAYEHLERMRAAVAGAADHVDGEIAQAAMDAWAARRLRTFEDAERGLCFGRLDFETVAAAALHRPALGARRRAAPARRQLAGACGAPVLHRHATGPARAHAAAPVPLRRTAARRHRRRGTRRHGRRRRGGRRLPARGARARPRRAHARHRRDDPGRPVPADHARPRRGARDPGRPRHRQDRGRTAPRVVARLHARRRGYSAAACSSSARTEPSWSTSRTCCLRSARTWSSSAPCRSSSTASSPNVATRPTVAELKADTRLAERRSPRGRAPARVASRRSS